MGFIKKKTIIILVHPDGTEEEFLSQVQAGLKYNIPLPHLNNVLKGKDNTVKGFGAYYKGSKKWEKKENKVKSICSNNTEVIFTSVKDAATALDIGVKGIYMVLNCHQKTSFGYKFEYLK